MSDKARRGPDFSAAGPVDYQPPARTPGPAKGLSAQAEAQLFAIPGVVSVGIGAGPTGGTVIAVGVMDAGVGARLPREVEGRALVVDVTGPIDALPAC